MFRGTVVWLRRGKPKKPGLDKTRFVPQARKPHQGGQNYFNTLQLQQRDQEAAREIASAGGTLRTSGQVGSRGLSPELASPLADFPANRMVRNFDAPDGFAQASRDGFESRRGFNELDDMRLLQREVAGEKLPDEGDLLASARAGDIDDALPPSVTDNEYVKNTFGYSLLKKKSDFVEPNASYNHIDPWAEQPRYSKATYFLYLVNRRRNAYAVIYDYDGKRVLPTYSVGNRGLKNTDKGFRQDGSKENAHQITSQYINDALPKIYEREMAAGRMRAGDTGKKIDVVVRVMGFYNGRTGAVRAVKDRQDVLDIKYFEDITPYQMPGGGKMPRARAQPA
uniref:Uncharacterized protein n=1 Tax=Neobodo designis TaxID=312471 RepID=A0A7S1LEU6_NEODS|mmetsp:Transcript_207/g.814  ORF Transcript_207/g.814 Transcript_207/m.814 type:complete len:338 (+) Transcript_207:35-1048(+)